MNLGSVSLLCWLLLSGALYAAPCLCPHPPFEDGELARFRVQIGPLKVGEGTALVRRGVPLPAAAGFEAGQIPEPAWQVEGRGITTGVVAFLYNLDDWLTLWMRPETFQPVYREVGIDERNERAFRSMRYDFAAGKAEFRRNRFFYRRNAKREKVTCRDAPLPPRSFEAISLFFHLRCRHVDVGETFIFPVHENGKTLKVEVRADGLEEIRTLWGRQEALRARIRVLEPEDPKDGRPLWVWVSADRRRIPLQFVADLKFANLKGDLVGYRASHGAEIVGELDPSFVRSESGQNIECPSPDAES